MEKKFIEWDLPLKEISEASAKEKSVSKKHPSSVHRWWARRPLASSRATNFAALIDDPGEENPKKRKEIMELISKISPWDAVKDGRSEEIRKAQEMIEENWEEPPKVLDPFAGGGSIPLEAIRLGCETYASDYNPVAVFIEKATLEWPQKFGYEVKIPPEEALERELKESRYSQNKLEEFEQKNEDKEKSIKVNLLVHLVEKYGKIILDEVKEEILQFFPESTAENLVGKKELNNKEGWTPAAYFWARTIPCQNPNCDGEIPLIRQFWISKKDNKKIAYRPTLNKENNKIDFDLLEGEELKKARDEGFNPSNGTVSRGNANCLICDQVTKVEKIRQLGREGKIGQRMIAVALHHPKETGKKYRLADEQDKRVFQEAGKYLEKKVENWSGMEKPIPDEKIPVMSGVFNAPIYGLDVWGELFNQRQKLTLVTFVDKIKEKQTEIEEYLSEEFLELNGNDKMALRNAVMGYIGILTSKIAGFNSTLSRWRPQVEGIAPTYGRQALPMRWDFVEVNQLTGTFGNFSSFVKILTDYIETNSGFSPVKAIVEKGDATDLKFDSNSFDAVFTDPPYYDNVPYADLSDFFYVWLKRSVGDLFPELFSTPLVSKSGEICEMKGWDSERYSDKDKQFFENMLSESFKEAHRVLKSGGIAVIVYGHKTTEGWETMLNSLINSEFVVTASWPVHTERKERLRAKASASLSSSIYMVCRKTDREEVGFWKDIKPQIKDRVEEKLHQFWNKGVVGGDFFISAIGPGMEIYSQYENVERYSGEVVTTLDLLEYIRSITTDFVVNNLLKDASPTEVDSASQFYLAYRWTYLDNKVEFDDARRIASGMGIELDEFSGKNGFVKQARKYTSVLGPKDREGVEKIDNMVDVMHKCVLFWDEGKQDEIKRLLSETEYGEKPAFWQFCQAVAETLLNGNKEKQLLEGFLTGKDKYSKSSKEEEQIGLDQFGGD